MKYSSRLSYMLRIVVLLLILSGCQGDGDESNNATLITLRGQVESGTAAVPGATCQLVNRMGNLLGRAIADGTGTFQLLVAPDIEGFIGCNPSGFPNLILSTFVSTVGVAAGTILPVRGFEKVSPLTTVMANVIAHTAPANPQARKDELLRALADQDPDLTMLTGAATELFEAMFETGVTTVDFSDSGEEGDAGGSDGSGVSGDVGDGAEFSPFVDIPCQFALHPDGNHALHDLLRDGRVDRADLQAIAAQVAQDAGIGAAFARLFPQGIQVLVAGQPLLTRTNADGAYFLPIPPRTPGFVTCTPRSDLTLNTFVRGRQVGEPLQGQDVSPPSQFFTAFLLPQLAPQDVPAVQNNFLVDIGNLREAVNGVVSVETVATPAGRIMADTDGDGIACSFLGGAPAAAIDYPAAGGVIFVATTLFNALVLETRTPALVSYTTLLGALLNRTDAAGSPLLEAFGDDLVLGGVPAARAPRLAALWNGCVQASVEQDLLVALPRVVRAGRLRVTVRNAAAQPLVNARVAVTGAFVAASSRCSSLLESAANRLLCQTGSNGQVIFILFGDRALTATPVTLTVETVAGGIQQQTQANFVPPATLDVTLTVPAP
jgi:hypothetical protein